MIYKAVINDNYLCHYNKNHSKANGQFVSGDGDGDGVANDHANRSKNNGGKSSRSSRESKRDASYEQLKKTQGKKMGIGKGLMWGGIGGYVASLGLLAIGDATDSDLLRGMGLVSSIADTALTVSGTIVYDKAKQKMRKAADQNFKDSIKNNARAQKYMKDRDKYSSDDGYSSGYRYY